MTIIYPCANLLAEINYFSGLHQRARLFRQMPDHQFIKLYYELCHNMSFQLFKLAALLFIANKLIT